MKRCAAGVGACCEGEESKDGYVPASRDDIESQSSTNVASKRVRQSTPDSGEILKARNGEEMNDANVWQNHHVDPSWVNARKSLYVWIVLDLLHFQ